MSAALGLSRLITNGIRRYLAGPGQPWAFERPAPEWSPPRVEKTSLYLHVPLCRNDCPYCPYLKEPYDERLLQPFADSAAAEIDWWARAVGPAELTSIYVGGGTPTVALGAVGRVLDHARRRFRVTGEVCLEANPADIGPATVRRLRDLGVNLVSLGVQSFCAQHLALLGRGYGPEVAARALGLLATGGFSSVNADMIFALPGQQPADVIADLERAAELGADQLTAYPLFTFPYSAIGRHLRRTSVRMPDLRRRRRQYKAIHDWCSANGFARVSVWGFKRGAVPRYSSVTRDGYIGIGPGAASYLPDGFALNTFSLDAWFEKTAAGMPAIALRLPFTRVMAGWWWLYWRLYDTRVPLYEIEAMLGTGAAKARLLLAAAERLGLAVRRGDRSELTERGAFWIHLAQNYFALDYVNTIWTRAREQPWPDHVAV